MVVTVREGSHELELSYKAKLHLLRYYDLIIWINSQKFGFRVIVSVIYDDVDLAVEIGSNFRKAIWEMVFLSAKILPFLNKDLYEIFAHPIDKFIEF